MSYHATLYYKAATHECVMLAGTETYAEAQRALLKEMAYYAQLADGPRYPLTGMRFEITEVCDTCGGQGEVRQERQKRAAHPVFVRMKVCPTCKGKDGAARRKVE